MQGRYSGVSNVFYVPGSIASIELCLRRTLVLFIDYSAENSRQKSISHR